MSDHDPDLHRRLRDLAPPPHRHGFWAEVRAGLDADAAGGPGAGSATPRRSGRRWARPHRPLLAAAAVIAVLALAGVGVLVTRDPEPQEVVTEPDPGPAGPGPTTTEPGSPGTAGGSGPLRPVGEPTRRGSGVPVAVDPQGRYLYIADDAPGGGTGCGASPAQALFVEPIGGGERRVALAADELAGAGTVDLFFSGDGRVAVRPQCDGTGASVVTGTVAGDGTFAETFRLTIPDLDAGRGVDVDRLTDLAWSPEGQILATTFLVGDGVHRHLYSFPPAPSEVSDLGIEGATAVEVTDDGRIVTLHDDGAVRVDGEARFSAGDDAAGLDVAPRPDGGGQVVVTGGRGVRVGSFGGDDGTAADARSLPVPPTPGEVTRVEIVDGTTTIVYAVAGPDGRWVGAVDGAEPARDAVLVPAGRPTPVVLAPDGSRLFTIAGSAEEPVVLERRLEA